MKSSGRFMSLAIGVVVALALHLMVGWVLSPLGAVAAAWWRNRGTGILLGTIVLVASWGSVIVYSFAVAPTETAEMTRVISSIVGFGPGFITVLLTALVAALLGAAGGGVGAALRRVVSA